MDNWAAEGIIPPPRKRGGKPMWKWSEVDEWLTIGPPEQPVEAAPPAPVSDRAGRIRDATRRALQERKRKRGHGDSRNSDGQPIE